SDEASTHEVRASVKGEGMEIPSLVALESIPSLKSYTFVLESSIALPKKYFEACMRVLTKCSSLRSLDLGFHIDREHIQALVAVADRLDALSIDSIDDNIVIESIIHATKNLKTLKIRGMNPPYINLPYLQRLILRHQGVATANQYESLFTWVDILIVTSSCLASFSLLADDEKICNFPSKVPSLLQTLLKKPCLHFINIPYVVLRGVVLKQALFGFPNLKTLAFFVGDSNDLVSILFSGL
ncbi:hypothetical protein H0H87_002971, partial [Tephrocybe sp. NHM501043]